YFFFFTDTAPTEIYTLSLHDALPIWVLAVVEELGYRPNSAARALVTGRTGTVGVVALVSNLYGPANTLYGMEIAAREAGYGITRSEEHTSELQSQSNLVCRLLLEKKK